MKRGFTLIEILLVLSIVALGWFWVPSLFQSSTASAASHFYTHFNLLHARARMEALVRQQPMAFALRSDMKAMAVITQDTSGMQKLTQAEIPADVIFDPIRSSSAGVPGIFAPASTDDGLWRAWWYNPRGQPSPPGGTLFFKVAGQDRAYRLANEGALLPL